MVPLNSRKNLKGEEHMFTGLRKQLDFGDSLIMDIVPKEHALVKIKSIYEFSHSKFPKLNLVVSREIFSRIPPKMKDWRRPHLE